MKFSKFLIIAIAASASFLSACTADDDDVLAKRELVFRVSMDEKETRATAGGTWQAGDLIAVRVGDEVKMYTIDSDVAHGIDADNTFYWEDFNESSVMVTAWSFGSREVRSFDNAVTVESDQSTDENYGASDFLYAKSTSVTKGSITQLVFCHQMGRLNINIKLDEETEVEKVTIGNPDTESKCFIAATFEEPTGEDNYGKLYITDENQETDVITTYKEATPAEGYDASFSACIIPYQYEDVDCFITLSDGSKFSFWFRIFDTSLSFEEGYVITANVTIKNKQLSVGIPVTQNAPVTVEDWKTQN
jgi:hypothetical protein